MYCTDVIDVQCSIGSEYCSYWYCFGLVFLYFFCYLVFCLTSLIVTGRVYSSAWLFFDETLSRVEQGQKKSLPPFPRSPLARSALLRFQSSSPDPYPHPTPQTPRPPPPAQPSSSSPSYACCVVPPSSKSIPRASESDNQGGGSSVV